jgi:hypothetical protein
MVGDDAATTKLGLDRWCSIIMLVDLFLFHPYIHKHTRAHTHTHLVLFLVQSVMEKESVPTTSFDERGSSVVCFVGSPLCLEEKNEAKPYNERVGLDNV